MTLDARAEAIQTFRDRIQQGDRTRLSQDDLEAMIGGFVEALRGIRAKTKIRALCEAEIKLLEEGYPQASVAKYLGRYRKAIAAAVEDGSLPITRCTSHHYVHRQRVTGIQEERHEHWALTYLKYSNEVYESLDKRQQAVKLNRLRVEDVSEVDEMPDMLEVVPVALELPLTVTPNAKANQSKHSGDDGDDDLI
jgi:Telomere resolvase